MRVIEGEDITLKSELFLKRLMDVIFAGVALIVLSPVLLLIVVAIKVDSRGNSCFFNDAVSGLGGRRFTMYKFRTMHPHPIDYSNRPEVFLDNPLITRVGRVLRRLKLDELPQLLNVLKGDMSLVGPRPMDTHRFSRLDSFEKQRSLMRPGLTGWAQIHGNINRPWSERVELDIWYVANWSIGLDCKIVVCTIPVIFQGERHVETTRRIADHTYQVLKVGSNRFKAGSDYKTEG